MTDVDTAGSGSPRDTVTPVTAKSETPSVGINIERFSIMVSRAVTPSRVPPHLEQLQMCTCELSDARHRHTPPVPDPHQPFQTTSGIDVKLIQCYSVIWREKTNGWNYEVAGSTRLADFTRFASLSKFSRIFGSFFCSLEMIPE